MTPVGESFRDAVSGDPAVAAFLRHASSERGESPNTVAAYARDLGQFALFLRAFVDLEIPHIQFNVVRKEDLIAAKKHPEQYRSLTVRVAGYTAYFTELADELQDEIIARTSYADI